jgi:hypothetical protein
MLKKKDSVIHERGIPIPIQKKNTTCILQNPEMIYYGLNKNIFDPTKSSPPNDFLDKLKKRMKMLEFSEES